MYESVVSKHRNPLFVFSFLCLNYKQFDLFHNSGVLKSNCTVKRMRTVLTKFDSFINTSGS